jgi:16S rRNA (cytidine1402-2'-O)-methyltransferase
MLGTLYVVATPIGNLADITQRAIQILKDVDLIACEDTRHTRKLLQHFGINTKTTSYHEHNENQRGDELLDLLERGKRHRSCFDAGTPAISDPGFRLVRSAIENEITVVPVPGPSALITALVAAGLPTDEFFFAGFLPRVRVLGKHVARAGLCSRDVGLLRGPHRLSATLKDAYETLGERGGCCGSGTNKTA